jgi:hypothetical protein
MGSRPAQLVAQGLGIAGGQLAGAVFADVCRRLAGGAGDVQAVVQSQQALGQAQGLALLAWPFTRILPGHGEVFEDPEAVAKARAAMGWALG